MLPPQLPDFASHWDFPQGNALNDRPDDHQATHLGREHVNLVSTLPGKCQDKLEAEFSPPDVVQRARRASDPVFEVGAAVEPTFNAGVIIAEPVCARGGKLVGIIATNLSLGELSEPLKAVVQAQQDQGRSLMISIIEDRGELIATPNPRRILQTVLDELPGADQVNAGPRGLTPGSGADGQDWLFSAVPVPYAGWAVVVQRPEGCATSTDSERTE